MSWRDKVRARFGRKAEAPVVKRVEIAYTPADHEDDWVPRNRAERRSVRKDRVRVNRAEMRARGKSQHARRIPLSAAGKPLTLSRRGK